MSEGEKQMAWLEWKWKLQAEAWAALKVGGIFAVVAIIILILV